LAGRRHAKTFPSGSVLFQACDVAGRPVPLPGIPYTAELWFDDPRPYTQLPTEPAVSILAAATALSAAGTLPLVELRAAGLTFSALVDSGATHDFVNEELLRQLHLPLRSSAWSFVTLADGGKQSILGQTCIRVSVGSLKITINPYVLSSFTDTVSIILGSTTLRQHGAALDFDACTLRLSSGTSSCVVPWLTACKDDDPAPAPLVNFAAVALCAHAIPESIGRKAAVRLLRKGGHALLVRPTARLNAVATQVSTQDSEVSALLEEYSDVFREVPGLPPVRPVDHTIPLVPGALPVSRPMYRLSPLELDEVKRQVTDLLAKGMVRPSTSPYSSPILFVGKKDGTLRMCIDYRGLNSVTFKNRYPLPRVDDLLDKLRGAACFSSIDLQQGYNQIRIAESDIPQTAFRTPFGHFEYTVLSFGLVNAPAAFQAVIDRTFRPYMDKFVVCYLDDILVYSKTKEEHLQHVSLVLDILRREQLYAKQSKCFWSQNQVEYLGHVVSSDGVRMDPRKTAAVRDWPVPASLHEIRKFVGLTNYFRKFIASYSSLAAPLTSLTRKDAFTLPEAWTPACQQSFDAIKRALADDIVLNFPDYSQPFRVELISDASLFCCRMVDLLRMLVRNFLLLNVTIPRASKSYLPLYMPSASGDAISKGALLWLRPIINHLHFCNVSLL